MGDSVPTRGSGGGLVVSVLAFCSDDLNLNPTVFFCEIFLKKDEDIQRVRNWHK